jgi:hypothetical protein
MASWNTEILNTNVAPGIAVFTHAEIPDLTADFPEADHWLVNQFLNQVFRTGYPDGFRQVVLASLRRIKSSFDSYHEARCRTLDYLKRSQSDNPLIREYFGALDCWETTLLGMNMAMELYNSIFSKKAFQRNDGSREERIYTMAN